MTHRVYAAVEINTNKN